MLVTVAPALSIEGVGIKYGSEDVKFGPGENCLNYRVYNPGDETLTAELVASGELEHLFKSSDRVGIPAHTQSSEAKSLKICFDIKRINCGSVYSGGILSSGFNSELVAMPTVASAPLTIEVVCDDVISGAAVAEGSSGVNFGQVFYIIVVIFSLSILTILSVTYYRNPVRKRKKYMGMYHEAIQLQQDLIEDPFNRGKRFRFNEVSSKLDKMRKEF